VVTKIFGKRLPAKETLDWQEDHVIFIKFLHEDLRKRKRASSGSESEVIDLSSFILCELYPKGSRKKPTKTHPVPPGVERFRARYSSYQKKECFRQRDAQTRREDSARQV